MEIRYAVLRVQPEGNIFIANFVSEQEAKSFAQKYINGYANVPMKLTIKQIQYPTEETETVEDKT